MKKRKSILLVKEQSDSSEIDENIEEQETNGDNHDDQDMVEESTGNGTPNGVESMDDDENDKEIPMETKTKSEKKRKPGIIYISSIPKHMNVALLREHLSPYGTIGRVFLQPDKKFLHRKKKKNSKKLLAMHFTEGWVEFESKRVAKRLAEVLNNQPISTKKGSKFCDILWSIKYLPRFKWIHLSERLTYEKQVYKQKLHAEISQARKEANFFQENLDKSEYVKKLNKKKKKENSVVQ